MKIAVLGTGTVGQTIATGLVASGHEVCLGSRTADSEAGRAWARQHGGSQGSFADAAAEAEVVWNCLPGAHCVAGLKAAGAENLAGKVLVDLANPLDFSVGFPPRLSVCNDDSLAETIQRAFPEARVVKTLNTVNASLMTTPGHLPGDHDVFMSGDDDTAKAIVRGFLRAWGWQHIHDLGVLKTARGTEGLLLAWLPLFQALGTAEFNWHIHR